MTASDGGTWVEHLNPAECWALLAGEPVGRIGVLSDSAPEIYPVNHAVDRETLVFRTDPGGKLRALLRSPAVCFEVDAADPVDGTWWSVLVKGRAAEIARPDELRQVAALALDYWALGEKVHWVRIVPDEVTGRRLWNVPHLRDRAGPAPGDAVPPRPGGGRSP